MPLPPPPSSWQQAKALRPLPHTPRQIKEGAEFCPLPHRLLAHLPALLAVATALALELLGAVAQPLEASQCLLPVQALGSGQGSQHPGADGGGEHSAG